MPETNASVCGLDAIERIANPVYGSKRRKGPAFCFQLFTPNPCAPTNQSPYRRLTRKKARKKAAFFSEAQTRDRPVPVSVSGMPKVKSLVNLLAR
jgi:hypothetical protein